MKEESREKQIGDFLAELRNKNIVNFDGRKTSILGSVHQVDQDYEA